MANKKQYFGIKYPFMLENNEELFLDLNESSDFDIRSQILHLIFTPKKQRIRMPDFGTDLIRYIFEQNDELTWNGVEEEIKNAVSKYVPRATLDKVEIIMDEENNDIFVQIDYSVKKGSVMDKNKVMVKI